MAKKDSRYVRHIYAPKVHEQFSRVTPVWGVIYLITNKVNGKVYVGQTIQSMRQRWKSHVKDARLGADKPLHRAMRKWGSEGRSFLDGFIHEILDIASSQFVLNEKESYYIKHLRATEKRYGYNLLGGGNQRGECAQEYRDMFRDITTNLWTDPDYAQAVADGVDKFWNSEDGLAEREKRRERKLKDLEDPEQMAKQKEYSEIRWAREGERERYGAKSKAFHADPDTKLKHSYNSAVGKRNARIEESFADPIADLSAFFPDLEVPSEEENQELLQKFLDISNRHGKI